MRKKAIIMLVFLILIVIAAAFGIKKLKESRREQANRPVPSGNYPQSTTAPELPGGLSSKYIQGYTERSEWLDEKLIAWKPKEYKPTNFMGFHILPSTDFKDYTNSEDDMRFLDMLIESGADIISVGVEGSPEDMSSEDIARYDKLFSAIRDRNKTLKIWMRSHMYSPAKKAAKVSEATKYIIKKWRPEYYSITHEPKADSKEGKEYIKSWVGDACNIAKETAKEAGYEVKTTATAINSKAGIGYADYFADMPCLDIVGFDIYGTWGLCEDCEGGNIVEDKIKLIHDKGKESWIEEFWLSSEWEHPVTNPPKEFEGFYDPRRVSWDTRFMKVMAYYAQKNNMIGIEPWFTTQFVLYPGYNIREFKDESPAFKAQYIKDLRSALLEGKRTQAFYTFKELTEKIK